MFKSKSIFYQGFLFSFSLFLMLTGSLFFLISNTNGANQGNVTVQATVPAGANICGDGAVGGAEACDNGVNNGVCPQACSALCTVNNCGGNGGSDAFPTISNVVVTILGSTSARISWVSNDDKAGFNVKLEYGPTNLYGTTAYNGETFGTNVVLVDLLPNTKYFYKFTVTDSALQQVLNTGDFTTDAVVENLAILNKQVQISDLISATVSWNTNKVARGQVLWGKTNQYGGTAVDNDLNQNKALLLQGLIANTLYHYKIIATDGLGNSVQTVDDVFTMPKNDLAPPDVSNLELAVGQDKMTLTWVNPTMINVPDFLGVKVLRKIGGASADKDDGLLVYEGGAEAFVDNNVLVNVNYFYTIFSYNTSGKHSGGVFKSGKIPLPPVLVENCSNGLDDDGDGKIDCLDPDCALDNACKLPPGGSDPEVCNNGLDDDGDGKIDCLDPDCTLNDFCKIPPGGPTPEICNNSLDDDGDGKIDCLDLDCAGFPACAIVPVDPNIPVVVVPTSTVPVFEKLHLNDLIFLGGNRQISLTVKNKEIFNLAGYGATVGVSKKVLAGSFEKMVFVEENGASHQFVLNPLNDTYYVDFVFPGTGAHRSYILIDYGSGQVDTIEFVFRGLSLGRVTGKGASSVDEVKITLLNGAGIVMEVAKFGEKNPIITDKNGLYGWLVPNGQYYLLMQKDGYFERKVPVKVENNIINALLEFTIKPPPIKLELKNLTEQVQSVSKVVTEVVSDFSNNPNVQNTVSQVVAPTAVGVVTVGAITAISWSGLISFLQLLLFQPLMFFGWKKREKWGMVYNSLNKLPIDLAVVRLIDVKTGRLVQSRVTDMKGRYIFDAKPGEYRITVNKDKYNFPSLLLKDFKTDGQRVDIYHGETIRVDENSMILTVNIPLDPLGAGEYPKRLVLQRFLHATQVFLSWTGLFVIAGAYYISRQWYVAVLFVFNLFILVVLKRLVALKKPKGWGIVYDSSSKKPISRVIARLFDSQFNKLVATQVTDGRGRYYFLAGGNKYYVVYSHEKYQEKKTEIIDTGSQKNDLIVLNVALQKNV